MSHPLYSPPPRPHPAGLHPAGGTGIRRRGGLAALLAALALLVTGGQLAATAPAHAAGQAVTVDLGTTQGAATGVGSGFLYGLSEDGTGPDDSLLAPLAPRSARGGGARLDGGGWVGDNYTPGSGYTRRLNSALAQARRLTTPPYDGTYDLLVSDIWGADSTQPAATVYPCTGGDCGNWQAFLRRLAADVAASGVKVRYDIWNEPAGAFFPPGFNTAQYYQMWDTAVRELRAAAPQAVIVGPSLWDFSPGNVSPFLDHAKAAGTVPDVINWHFSGTPVADAQTMRSLLDSKGLGGLPLSMNEYLHADEQHAGHQAWYLAQLANSGIDSASHAIWDDCCAAGTLDGVLVRSNGVLRPTGQWWVYKGYADMTGSRAQVSTQGTLAALATVDPVRRRASVLAAAPSGVPSADLTVNGLTSPALSGGSGVTVTVQRIPDQAPLEQPVTVSTQTVPAGTDSVHLSLAGTADQDAFLVTAVPAGQGGTTVDAAVTGSGPDYFRYGTNWGQTNGVSDMYNSTANWSYVPGSTALLHFTGRQVTLRAVRDTDQGRMYVSVDGSVPVKVDNYAPGRAASSSVWTSPQLPAGPHTVVVTVAPDINPASGGHNIALDSAMIQK